MEKIEPQQERRHLIFHHGAKTALFQVTVTYAPDVEESHYGSVEVKMLYPVKKTLKSGYPLELFPNVRDTKGPDGRYIGIEDNIEPANVGIGRLFVESNKVAGLLAKSTLCIPSKKFTYDDMRIIDLDISPLMLEGIVEVGDAELCEGDRVNILNLDVTESGQHYWQFKRPVLVPKTKLEKFKAWIDCTFRASKYANRYSIPVTGRVYINNIRVCGTPVEADTYK